MEVYNYDYGVKFRNALAARETPVNFFFPKNKGRIILYSNLSFLINDVDQYQTDLSFVRADITLLNSKGVVVPLPATDDALYDMLVSFMYSDQDVVNGNVVPITGATYLISAADNGRTILAYEPPSAKTITIPAGLPLGLKTSVIKMYATAPITFVGSGGMVLTGLDLLLDKLGSRMDILITGPAAAVLVNIGG